MDFAWGRAVANLFLAVEIPTANCLAWTKSPSRNVAFE